MNYYVQLLILIGLVGIPILTGLYFKYREECRQDSDP